MTRFAPLARLPRPARWAVRILIVLLVLLLVLTLYVRWTIQRSFPQTSGRVAIKGLSKDVTVHRDEWGVPQIYADDAEDLMRAQGYVHAQDRFWEMDFRRHVTADGCRSCSARPRSTPTRSYGRWAGAGSPSRSCPCSGRTPAATWRRMPRASTTG